MRQTFGPYLGHRMEHFAVLNENLGSAAETVQKYLDSLDDNRAAGRGLTFVGPNGVGKTLLASIVLNEAADRGYRIESIEQSMYVSLYKDQFTLREIVRKTDNDDYMDEYIKCRQHVRYIEGRIKRGSADWVLFDDIGREHAAESGWSEGTFFDTLRSRWNRRLPTLFTTNLSMGELMNRYTEGVTSLLHESSTIVVMKGDDYRCRGGL